MKKNTAKGNKHSPNFFYIEKRVFGFAFWIKITTTLFLFATLVFVSMYYLLPVIANLTYLIMSLIALLVIYANFLTKSLIAIINTEKNAQKEKVKIQKAHPEEDFGVYPVISFNRGDNPFDHLPKA